MKKLKKLRNKLRAWIIHKLGGVLQSEIHVSRTIAHTEYHPVTLTAKYTIPTDAIYRADEHELCAKITQELCSMLGGELVKNLGTLVEIQWEENIPMRTAEYRAYLRVLAK